MPPKSLGEVLTASAKRFPRKTALIFGQKKITYRQLNEITDRIAAGLVARGIKRQDKVAIFLDNCPEFIISYYAIVKAGAVAVPINFMFKADEAKYIAQDSRAVCLITSRVYTRIAQELRLRVLSLTHLITTTKTRDHIPDFTEIERVDTSALARLTINPTDVAVILYTSGTTGHPKGAMLSHQNLIANALDCSQAIRVTHKDGFICILPLFHSFAATVCMNLPLLLGSRIVVMKTLRPFKRIIRAIRRNNITIFVAIPSIFTILKDTKLPKILHTPLMKLFNPLRLCVSGAAALPASTLEGFEKKFRIPLLEGYGLTEASPVVTMNPFQGPRIPGSIGIAISENILLRIVDDKDATLGEGKVGELLVKGPNVMQGYLNQPDSTGETIKNGWLYTGDMARIDARGYAYIVGRKKEMINVRGLNVYPREIEEVLYQNPAVKEAAVIGILDAHKGEVPKAFIVLREGNSSSEHQILHYLREKLAPYKIPKYVEFRQSLPKNSTGKILKRLLLNEEPKTKQ